jgi:hypothetical protein
MQVAGRATSSAVLDTMKMGARCIELDVFSRREDRTPVVMHGGENFKNSGHDIPLSTSVPFEEVIKSIAEHAFTTTDDPLFLIIENNTNRIVETNDKMAGIIQQYLGPRLLVGKQNIARMRMRDLLGKVVVMSGAGDCGMFSAMINSSVYDLWVGNYSSRTDPKDVADGGCARVYPAESIPGVFSKNYDPEPFFNRRPTFIALNYQTPDTSLQKYLKKFGKCSIVPK